MAKTNCFLVETYAQIDISNSIKNNSVRRSIIGLGEKINGEREKEEVFGAEM